MNYGKLDNGRLTRFTPPLRWNGHVYGYAGDATMREAGWLPIKDAPAPSGQFRTGWQVEDGAIRPAFAPLPPPPPPPPRTFSKLKAVAALKAAGLWVAVKNWIVNHDLYDEYLAAQVFTEDNEYFRLGIDTLKAELNLTDEAVESLLAQCVADTAP